MGWAITIANNVTTFVHTTSNVTDRVLALSQGQYYIELISGGTTIQIKSAAGDVTTNGFNIPLLISDITTIGGGAPSTDMVTLIGQLVAVMPVNTGGGEGGLTLSSTLSGLNVPSPGEPITSSSTILDAFANLQGQINDLNA